MKVLLKVKNHGVNGSILGWIRNWLENRTQRVGLKDRSSRLSQVTSGVPQGLVLGPLLFLIYVNDMEKGINAEISKFADDTKNFSTVCTTEQQQKLQSSLDSVNTWSKIWQMSFNANKCKSCTSAEKREDKI